MTEMVERVATSIAMRVGLTFAALAEDDTDGIYGKRHWLELARDAIAATREPTEPMVDAAVHEESDVSREGHAQIHRAMIDAALGAQP